MPLDVSQREALRQRVAGWRAAEARQIEERRAEGPPSAEEAWTFALELWELNPAAFAAPDLVREREIDEARRAWAKLRARLIWGGTVAAPR
jgi:hypothetical protein